MSTLTAEDRAILASETREHRKNRMTLSIHDKGLKGQYGSYVKIATKRINHAMSNAKQPEWFEENPMHSRKVY